VPIIDVASVQQLFESILSLLTVPLTLSIVAIMDGAFKGKCEPEKQK